VPEALAEYLAVPDSDPRYPAALARAVALAWTSWLGCRELLVAAAPFVRRLSSSSDLGPHGHTLYMLGRLCERADLFEWALEIYELLLFFSGEYRDCRPRREALLARDVADARPWQTDVPPPSSLPLLAELRPPPPRPVVVRGPAARLDATPGSSGSGSSSPDLQSLLAVGSVFAGRYRILATLGAGSYGAVLRVMDLELHEELALKVLARGPTETRALRRFRQEMRILRRLGHPNIVQAWDFGSWKGFRYLSMELLRGRALDLLLQSHGGGAFPPSLAVELAAQALDGLDAAHRAGVLHRDVKPANLFVLFEGPRLKLTDFGLARVLQGDVRTTESGVVVGSPAYMAPERIQALQDDSLPASDLWSVGVVLYRMLTGRLPWDEEQSARLFRLILATDPPPPSTLNREIPLPLERVVLRMLQKDPVRRWADCREAREALLEAAAAG
jgi:serine/threonine-protein kinase